MTTRSISIATLLLSLACTPARTDTATPDAKPTEPTPTAAVSAADFGTVLALPHRTAESRSRDASRHPAETLAFFGVSPESKVVELWPGGGWYTEIIAPFVKDKGALTVTVFDPNGPAGYYGTDQAKKMIERLAADKAVLGNVQHVIVPQKLEMGADGKVAKTTIQAFELGAENSADVVLTFRNSHGWYRNDALGTVYGAAFRVLKPGGTFGVEQHRAPEGADPNVTAEKGYISEATVIDAAKAVGFELVERSEINGNPKDTHDHPNGVWSLPPSLDGGEVDKAKYEAIGESDRMTLKFRKPG
ncbi:MAG: class I SAM-dependent methyltransferase [Deltaproteobacteria bacterium]|nr:class I SAM-dependent methyltransferase [Nannocystaceae bacterium]